jgi:hypothetical protein
METTECVLYAKDKNGIKKNGKNFRVRALYVEQVRKERKSTCLCCTTCFSRSTTVHILVLTTVPPPPT